jgi:hypothetical protein
MSARGTPGFDSRIVFVAGGALIALYAAVLAGAWTQGFTVLGSRDLVTRDFSVFWGAGRLALAGKAAAVYSWADLRVSLEAVLGAPSEAVNKTFHYPPIFLILLLPLALLPYATAAVVWLGGTLVVYLAAIRAILPGGTAQIAALAGPAVLFNFIAGQNGLLTAGLLGAALAWLDARPLAAGVLIGLASYKPQFGILLPFFLAVTGRWRVFAGASAMLAGLVAAAAALFGWAVFGAFAAALTGFLDGFSQPVPGAGHIEWARLASPYALCRALGTGAAAAWAVHLAVAITAAVASLWLAASRVSDALKAAALLTAIMLVTPYSELTDLAILTLAMAFLVRDGLSGAGEAAVLAVAFVLPLILPALPLAVRVAGLAYTAALAGPASCAILAAIIARRALEDRAGRRLAA